MAEEGPSVSSAPTGTVAGFQTDVGTMADVGALADQGRPTAGPNAAVGNPGVTGIGFGPSSSTGVATVGDPGSVAGFGVNASPTSMSGVAGFGDSTGTASVGTPGAVAGPGPSGEADRDRVKASA
jgi:hypothetical protein